MTTILGLLALLYVLLTTGTPINVCAFTSSARVVPVPSAWKIPNSNHYNQNHHHNIQQQQLWFSSSSVVHPPSSITTASTVSTVSTTRLHSARSVAAVVTTSTAAATAVTIIAKGLQTQLHANVNYVWTSILWLSTFGTFLERRTTIGKALSAPLATMALALLVANLGLIPFESSVYTIVNRFLVPLAVPLLLFDSDLQRVWNDTGTLLLAFGVGALATVVATLVAFPLIPLTTLGPDVGWRVACALAARHIGGAINFVAVAETLKIGGDVVAAAIAADNVVVALYFAFLFSIAKAGDEDETTSVAASSTAMASSSTLSTDSSNDTTTTTTTTDGNATNNDDDKVQQATPTISEMAVEDENTPSTITLPTIAISLSVASSLVTAGSYLTKVLLPTGTSSLPLISALTVMAATLCPTYFAKLSETGTALGVVFVQMFFACSGAAGSIRMVFEKAPALFAFSALQIGIHFGTLMTVGRWVLKLPKRELYLASNANVGGPTTAAAMAQAKEWKSLVLPALLIGILGYATATALALSLGPILVRMIK